MNDSRARILGLVLCVGLSISCSSIRVNIDFDPSVDFGAFRTYAWLPDPPAHAGDPRLHNALIDGRVRNAVNRELQARGFEEVSLESADFHITYYLGLETRIDVQTIHRSFNYHHRSWTGPGRTEIIVREYEVGTLLLDILDPGERSLLWRGSGNARVRESSDPAQRERQINEAVENILRRFPPH